MHRALGLLVALASLWACGGTVFGNPGDAGTDGNASSSSSGGSGGGSSSSGGGSTSSSGLSSSSGSGGGSSSGGSSSSSGGSGRVPVNHRPNDAQCATAPGPGTCAFAGSSGSPGFMCTTDAQCADAGGANGRCVNSGGGPAGCFCTYDACFHDNDCTGETCACHGSAYMGGDGNRCVPGNCHVDSDCGPGGYCSPTPATQGCGGLAGYYCHTPSDGCIDDSDCANSGGLELCTYSTTASRWECEQEQLCQ